MEIEKERNPDEFANDIRDIILETAKKHVPKRRRKNQPWISKRTLDMIDERRELKKHKYSSDEALEEYRAKCKEIKRSCKEDRQEYLKQKCDAIEQCFRRNNSRLAFNEIRSMTRAF